MNPLISKSTTEESAASKQIRGSVRVLTDMLQGIHSSPLDGRNGDDFRCFCWRALTAWDLNSNLVKINFAVEAVAISPKYGTPRSQKSTIRQLRFGQFVLEKSWVMRPLTDDACPEQASCCGSTQTFFLKRA